MTLAKFHFLNSKTEDHKISIENNAAILKVEDIPTGIEYIDFLPEYFTAKAGDDGYFVIPNLKDEDIGKDIGNSAHAALTVFSNRPDSQTIFPDNTMPIYAIVHNGTAKLAVVTGMPLDYKLIVEIKNNRYYIYPRFILEGEKPCEDISVKFFDLAGDNANYSGIARSYRKYQLDRKACQPIRERMKKYPVIGEATLGPEVRLRLGWKPVPPPVLEQTENNEPPMHVAITFDRAGEIIDEFHKQGIENAEFCLVGWNKSGHDGRFPDNFPVEPLLGGEKGLKRLIHKAKKYAYLICGHSNVMDAYSIAKRWEREDMLVKKDGQVELGGCWGGGQAYILCPKQAHEKNATQDFDDMAHLGFRGTHYLDVLSILRPNTCYHPEHPLTRREAGQWRGASLALAREKIGASGSEGSWDFCIDSLDYVLYTIFHPDAQLPSVCDRIIPLWHLVYHGIVHYNSSCDTVNEAVNPNKKFWLKNLEYGGRPLSYFYSKFLSNGNDWMGEVDCTCGTDDAMHECVKKIKENFEEYKKVRDLQLEFMEEHTELENGLVKVCYSNGSIILINYNDHAVFYQDIKISPLSYIRID